MDSGRQRKDNMSPSKITSQHHGAKTPQQGRAIEGMGGRGTTTNSKDAERKLTLQVSQAYGTLSPTALAAASQHRVAEHSPAPSTHSGGARRKPVSVWDQMQAHDAQLYLLEQEERRRRRLEGQNEMRAYLKGQMNGKKEQDQRAVKDKQAEEETVVQRTVQKMAAREDNRRQWLQKQMDQGKYLNNLNKLYKEGNTKRLAGGKGSPGSPAAPARAVELKNNNENQLRAAPVDIKPHGTGAADILGDGFVMGHGQADFVKDVGLNRVFTFENEKRQYHME